MKPANDAHARLSFDNLEACLAAMPDEEVRKACVATDGMPDHDVAGLLAGECERRNLDL